jgi:hypothetical protein
VCHRGSNGFEFVDRVCLGAETAMQGGIAVFR